MRARVRVVHEFGRKQDQIFRRTSNLTERGTGGPRLASSLGPGP